MTLQKLRKEQIDLPAKTSYVPTFTNLTVGNGTLTAYYAKYGDLVVGHINLTFGSTTSISAGGISVTLPTTPSAAAITPFGICILRETGVAQYQATLYYIASTTCQLRVLNASGTYVNQSLITATVPFTWATGDEMHIAFTYLE